MKKAGIIFVCMALVMTKSMAAPTSNTTAKIGSSVRPTNTVRSATPPATIARGSSLGSYLSNKASSTGTPIKTSPGPSNNVNGDTLIALEKRIERLESDLENLASSSPGGVDLDSKQDVLSGDGVVSAVGGNIIYLAVDDIPTHNSANLVTSGGVHGALINALMRPTGGTAGQFLRLKPDGTLEWADGTVASAADFLPRPDGICSGAQECVLVISRSTGVLSWEPVIKP